MIQRLWRTRFVRYALGSGLATLTSAVVFALVYRVFGAPPAVASVSAVVSGALVNFGVGRFWAWGDRERPALGRDLLSYGLVALVSAVLSSVSTSIAHAQSANFSPNARAVLVEGAYFATYAVLFTVKFLVLDRLVFRSRHQVPNTTRV